MRLIPGSMAEKKLLIWPCDMTQTRAERRRNFSVHTVLRCMVSNWFR